MLCCQALPYESTVCGLASRLDTSLAIVVSAHRLCALQKPLYSFIPAVPTIIGPSETIKKPLLHGGERLASVPKNS